MVFIAENIIPKQHSTDSFSAGSFKYTRPSQCSNSPTQETSHVWDSLKTPIKPIQELPNIITNGKHQKMDEKIKLEQVKNQRLKHFELNFYTWKYGYAGISHNQF